MRLNFIKKIKNIAASGSSPEAAVYYYSVFIPAKAL